MGISLKLSIQESKEELQQLYKKSASHLRPRIKMLQWILKSVHSIDDLKNHVGVSRNSIAVWKRAYRDGGLAKLMEFNSGGDYRSGFSKEDKEVIPHKLSEPRNAFTSYQQAQDWINKTFGVEKEYHAVNKFLKRNFGVKLKVGRKSHLKKNEEAVAFFKNAVGKDKTH